jgi:soluble cytochrome b562
MAMKKMSGAYRQLALGLKEPHDSDKSVYLTLAGTLKTEARTSRGLVSQKAAALPPAQQDAMVKAYQKRMDTLIAWIDSLTRDIQQCEWDHARKAMGAMKQQMLYGHKDFRTEE